MHQKDYESDQLGVWAMPKWHSNIWSVGMKVLCERLNIRLEVVRMNVDFGITQQWLEMISQAMTQCGLDEVEYIFFLRVIEQVNGLVHVTWTRNTL
jgi:hypothetical protein